MKERAFLARLEAVDRQVAAIETLAASLAARIRAGAVDPEHLHTLLCRPAGGHPPRPGRGSRRRGDS